MNGAGHVLSRGHAQRRFLVLRRMVMDKTAP